MKKNNVSSCKNNGKNNLNATIPVLFTCTSLYIHIYNYGAISYTYVPASWRYNKV